MSERKFLGFFGGSIEEVAEQMHNAIVKAMSKEDPPKGDLDKALSSPYMKNAEDVEKFNPNHGKDGKFAPGGSSHAIKYTGSLADHVVDGKLTKERQELHKSIMRQLLPSDLTSNEHPEITIMGGGPGSGKSTIISQEHIGEKNTLMIDPDKIKTMLPEYQNKLAQGDKGAAFFVHQEGNLIANKLIDIAVKNKWNIVNDGTGGSSAENLKTWVADLRAKGYKIKGVYVNVDTNTAVSRVSDRGKQTGRFVPEQAVRESHKAVSQVFPKVIKDYDELHLFDTRSNKPVEMFTKDVNGAKVKDKKLYFEFLKKARE